MLDLVFIKLYSFLGPNLPTKNEGEMLEKAPVSSSVRAAEKPGKREKFIELAESRTKNAIKAIRVIAKLGNKSAYEYTETDVKKIANALSKEIDALKSRMLSTGSKETVDFKL